MEIKKENRETGKSYTENKEVHLDPLYTERQNAGTDSSFFPSLKFFSLRGLAFSSFAPLSVPVSQGKIHHAAGNVARQLGQLQVPAWSQG